MGKPTFKKNKRTIKYAYGDDYSLVVELRESPKYYMVLIYVYNDKTQRWMLFRLYRFNKEDLRLAKMKYRQVYDEF